MGAGTEVRVGSETGSGSGMWVDAGTESQCANTLRRRLLRWKLTRRMNRQVGTQGCADVSTLNRQAGVAVGCADVWVLANSAESTS